MEEKENDESEDCLFCKIINSKEKNLVYEDDNFIGILDVNPKAEGHTLVIPKKHFRNILDTPNSLAGEYFEAIKKISLDLIDKGAGGVNIIFNTEPAAGQKVFHVHAHVIPRKEGDGLTILG